MHSGEPCEIPYALRSAGNYWEYLQAAPQPLHDTPLLILDTGLRVGEAVGLEWRDVHLEPVGAGFALNSNYPRTS